MSKCETCIYNLLNKPYEEIPEHLRFYRIMTTVPRYIFCSDCKNENFICLENGDKRSVNKENGMRNTLALMKKQIKKYKGIDLMNYENWFFRGQKWYRKKNRIKYNRHFIYGDQLNRDPLSKDNLIMNSDYNEWELYDVRSETLGLRAPINGYRKKQKRKYTEIMMFEHDIVKLHSSSEYDGFIGKIKIVPGGFWIVINEKKEEIPLDILPENDFWEIIGNTAGINDNKNATLLIRKH